VNPVSKAWRSASEGTSRTARWAAGGIRDAAKSGAAKVTGRGAGDAADATTTQPAAAPQAGPEKTFGERLADRLGHSRRTIGIAAGVALLVAMWIGWTAYVWAENGSTAGIGVLISWPAVLAAVTLVTAPFIGGAVAVRRHRAEEPVFAGAVVPETKETNPRAGTRGQAGRC